MGRAGRSARIGRVPPDRAARAGSAAASGSAAVVRAAMPEAVRAVATKTDRPNRAVADHRPAVPSTAAGRPGGSRAAPARGPRSAAFAPTPRDRRSTDATTRARAVARASDRGTVRPRPGRADRAAAPIVPTRVEPEVDLDPPDPAVREPDSDRRRRDSSPRDRMTYRHASPRQTIDRRGSTGRTRRNPRIASSDLPAAARRSDHRLAGLRSIVRARRTGGRRGPAVRPSATGTATATGPVAIARGGTARRGRRTPTGRGSRRRIC